MTKGNDAGRAVRILHLEDSPRDAELIREMLVDAGFPLQLDWAADEKQFTSCLQAGGYDLVLADYHLPAFEGESALRLTLSLCPGVPFICVSGAIGEEKAVELMKKGATDYVSKDRLEKLPLAMVRAIDEVRERTAHRLAEVENTSLETRLMQAQKMEAIGRLAGGVAHDFNNMLGVILGYAEMALLKTDPSQSIHADLKEIRKAAGRSVDLTRQLLAFARQQPIAPRLLDLNDTVAGMLKMLQRLIGEDIHLTWKPGISLWPVKVDPSQIDQILANLCVNVRDAISDVGKMIIETGNCFLDETFGRALDGFVPGEYVRICVSDDGCGMDKDVLDHLFEPFFTTKEAGKGTGLGLATVFGAVRQNNGFIDVKSTPGEGTTFQIYLPRYLGPSVEDRSEPEAKPAMGGQETILLVEDEAAILEVTRMMLEMQGYTVLTAGSPAEALLLARDHTVEIRLLMTDVIMPEMNGQELMKKLLSIRPGIKTLFMSGYTADIIANRGVLDEGVNFIQKPFSVQELAARVRELLDE